MTANILETIAGWGLDLVSNFGYGGLFLTMALESAAIPIPSEVVVPFGGFLASSGRFYFWLVVWVTTLGNLAGSLLLYFAGYYGGRPILEKYGKYVLVHRDDIDKMDHWLQNHGARVALFSRMIPGVRTFSSLVIGAGKVKVATFFWYTLLGSFGWNLLWAYAGFVAGSNWDQFQPYIRRFDYLIVGVIVIAAMIFAARHFREFKKTNHK